MNTKTIEQKAKAYDVALEDIRAIYPNLKGDAKLAVEHAFPQLAESEDEKVRKWIYNVIDSLGMPADEDAEKELEEMQPRALAYLEKQKEQKPAEWSDEDYNALKYVHELISFGYTENFFDAQTAADMRAWLNSHITSWKPSEEQMEKKFEAKEEPEYYQHFDPDC